MESIESTSDQIELNASNESSKQNGVKSIWDRFQTIPLVAPPLDIIETAKSICKNGIEGQGPPIDPRVTDLTWGWEMKGRSQIGDRNGAVFYRLNVDKRQVDNGFLLVCRGANSRSHFKVILFDLFGEILFEEICIKPIKASYTEAAIYFTKFETYSIGTTTTNNNNSNDLPRLFSILNNFQPSKKTLFPGQYLLCIQCTNILGLPTNFAITVVPSNNTLSVVNEIEEVDEAIINFKSTVDEVKQEYVQAKAAYEQSLLKVKQQEEQLSSLLEVRDKSYSLFIEGSIKIFRPILDNDAATNTNPHSAASDSTSSNVTGDISPTTTNEQAPTITAATLAANAAKTATEAWGGLTRRFSLGISQVKPILFSGGTVTSSVMNNEGDSDTNSSVGASDEPASGEAVVVEDHNVGVTSNNINTNSSVDSPLDSLAVSTLEYTINNSDDNNTDTDTTATTTTTNATLPFVDHDAIQIKDIEVKDITGTITTIDSNIL